MCIYDLHDFPRNGNRDGLIWKNDSPCEKNRKREASPEKRYLKLDFQFT